MATSLTNKVIVQVTTAANSKPLVNIPLLQIRVDPNQPRKLNLGFTTDSADNTPVLPSVRLENVPDLLNSKASEDETALVRLALNILQDGVRTPIIVTPAKNGTYQLVTGERRVTAALLARDWIEVAESGKTDIAALGYTMRPGYNYDTIPAVVDADAGDADRFRIQVAENLMRQDMSHEDTGRAWKKMLDDGLFPHVYAIARHFGLEETRVQSQIDMVDMAEDAAELRAIGIKNVETLGRLLSDLRVARKREQEPKLYNTFVQIWKERTTTNDDGQVIYPSARSVLDAARAAIKAQAVPADRETQDTRAVPVSHAPQAVMASPEPKESSWSGAQDKVADVFSDDASYEEELVVEEDAAPDENDLKAARVGVNIPRAPSAPALDRPHQIDTINLPAIDLSREQAACLLKAVGVNLSAEQITATAVVEALTSFRCG